MATSHPHHLLKNVQIMPVMEKAEKLKLLSFVNNEDFKYIFDKGKGKIVLELFYKEKINGIDFSNKKK